MCPCVEANKVVTVDASGSITIWHLKSSNLFKVKVDTTAPSPSSDALTASASMREYRNNSAEESRFATGTGASSASGAVQSNAGAGRSSITDAMFDACDSPAADTVDNKTVELPANPDTLALTQDFERAVQHDPSMWSATSSATPTATTAAALAGSEQTRTDSSEGADQVDQVRSDLYQHNISSPAAKAPQTLPLPAQQPNSRSTSAASSPRTGSVASASTAASAGKVVSASTSVASKTSLSSPSKATYVKPPQQSLNTGTASYDIMFLEEDGALRMEDDREEGENNAEIGFSGSVAPKVMDLSFTSTVPDVNLLNSQQSHRTTNAHGTAAASTASSAGAPATPRSAHTHPGSMAPSSSAPIDNPLAGLNVWMEMQSPVSAGKTGRQQSGQSGAAAKSSSPGYDSAEEGDNLEGQTSEEQARQMDSLDLLQRARANMNASRLGASAAAHAASAASSTGLPLTYYTEVEAAQQSNLYAINHGNAVPPSYCQAKSLMLCSDGSAVLVKYVNTGDQMVLGFPAPLAYCRTKCSIIEARLHESGNMIAALVRCLPSNAYYLVAWVLVGGGDIDDGTFVPSAVEWRCMGFADIGVVDGSSRASGASTIKGLSSVGSTSSKPNVCLEWAPSGALLVLTSQDNAASSAAHLGNNGLVKLTLIPPEVIYSGNLSLNWDDINQVVQSPLGRVLSVKSLPGVVVDHPHKDAHSQVPTVHVMLAGESRVMMVSLTVHKKMAPGAQSELTYVVWSDVRNAFII